MNRKLFWKLCAIISLITMALVYVTAELSLKVESELSQISDANKQKLRQFQEQADAILQRDDFEELYQWLQALQLQEETFATVIALETQEVVAFPHSDYRGINVRLGRQIDWGVHLHHDNPLIELPLSDGRHYLVFRLPDHMMPGRYWPQIHLMLHLFLPLILMVLVSYGLYRYLMRPLGKLERATRQFSQGNYEARVSPQLNGRSDELGRLAHTFDEMASRVGNLVKTQRHLLHDLSHELRTPLQRLELCLESEDVQHKQRLKKEADQMRQLVEDTLTLAWLENESPELRQQQVDIVGLLEAIVEDTQFEYPDRQLTLSLPDELEISDSSEKALNMALENIIRNAMRHTPQSGVVSVTASVQEQHCQICVEDQGGGVPDELLDMIFKPFFRVDKARGRGQGGFGLGLALAKRQIHGVGGEIIAKNKPGQGLSMCVSIPLHS